MACLRQCGLFLALTISAPFSVLAQGATIPAEPAVIAMKAEQAWVRATPPQQKVSTAYVILTSPVDDRLLGATSPAVGRAELHEMRMNGGVMEMRTLANGVRLPQGQAVGLTAGGYHLMLTGLQHPLVVGQTLLMELHFKRSAPLMVPFQVLPIGSSGPDREKPGVDKDL